MSGRNVDPHHIREARQYIGDARIDQSVAAFDAMARGKYKGAHSRTSTSDIAEHVRPDGEEWAGRSTEAVRRELERSRIIPAALTLACEHAPVGERCYVNGICGDRASRATAAKYAALG